MTEDELMQLQRDLDVAEAAVVASTSPVIDDGPALYEQTLIPFTSFEGQQLAGEMSDCWAMRCSSLLEAFEPQAAGAWCGLASSRIALRASQEGPVHNPVPTQQQFLDLCYTPLPDGRRIKSTRDMSGGLSLLQVYLLVVGSLERMGATAQIDRVDGPRADLACPSLSAVTSHSPCFVRPSRRQPRGHGASA